MAEDYKLKRRMHYLIKLLHIIHKHANVFIYPNKSNIIRPNKLRVADV